jgi:hypothetical protein
MMYSSGRARLQTYLEHATYRGRRCSLSVRVRGEKSVHKLLQGRRGYVYRDSE